ncbi:MAG: hypothetical protein MJZ23_07675 [Paludibacteraceae bacterium]|nr:hypothetical protein [Paludibacteraceae bacterium]
MRHTILTLAALLCLGCNAFAAKTIDGKKVTEVKEWVVNSGKKSLDHVSKYDKDGNKIEEIEYDKAGDKKSRTTYKYNANGKCVEEQHFDKFNKLEKTVKIEYNTAGKKSSSKTYLPNGKLKNEHVYEYITE